MHHRCCTSDSSCGRGRTRLDAEEVHRVLHNCARGLQLGVEQQERLRYLQRLEQTAAARFPQRNERGEFIILLVLLVLVVCHCYYLLFW